MRGFLERPRCPQSVQDSLRRPGLTRDARHAQRVHCAHRVHDVPHVRVHGGVLRDRDGNDRGPRDHHYREGQSQCAAPARSTFLFFVTGRCRQIQGNGRRFRSFTGDNATTTTLSRKASVVRRTFFGRACLHQASGSSILTCGASLASSRATRRRREAGPFWLGRATLGSTDCLNQLGLTHGRNTFKAKFGGHGFEFHQLHTRNSRSWVVTSLLN